MKGLLIVLIVLTMASMANALYISVNGVENPPDTAITLMPSCSLTIGVMGDGQTPQDMDCYLILEPIGVASMSGGVMLYTGDLSILNHNVSPPQNDTIDWLQGLGWNTNDAYWMVFAHSGVAPLNGTLVDEITLHCEDWGDVLLTLVNIYDDGENPVIITTYDTQIIHMIPEPMTLGLLGLGGLFLRRRK